ERRGLAGAVGADQADDAAGLDVQVDVVQGPGRLVALGQAARLDHGTHDVSSSPSEASAADFISVSKSSPRRCSRRYSAGHPARRERARADVSRAAGARLLTSLPNPLRCSVKLSSTSVWYALDTVSGLIW